ncbi:thioester reductase domain-containing protein [Umezawaea sp. Da 62-37]|uniref:thioester reductase domain-containing protein n=1 Tax=Umezawaea sp. Da 62-37 TaxID=3075927 RepID=UPI0028F706AB|nr:thioester reductase domain-containing protein [Umezawaea sp. Da 62-37]WNV87749.1 thioester reductase domain-containing protein [Umezawaea sp. Da 62-37]
MSTPEAVLGNDPLATSWETALRTDLREFARASLPDAMVPTRFVVLPTLPTLANGKVDRKNLPPLEDDRPPEGGYLAPRTTVESRLADVWADMLDVRRVGVRTDFFDLGGNSLLVMRMAAGVRETFDVRVDLRRFLEQPTIERLAGLVGATGDPALTDGGDQRGVRAEELRREAVLPEDVRPDPDAIPASYGPYTTILVTGATGYTGAYLVRELLDRSDAELLVLTRADNADNALDRVCANLEHYGILRPGDKTRLRGIAGDVGRPYLGLGRTDYRALARDVEMIVHNAADSRWTIPYHQAKPVNVLGTVEVLRLACRGRIKPVHYVCSTGAFPGRPGEMTWSEDPLPDPEGVVGGYRQTKWVSDTLVHTARERGVPASVYRPGALTGAQDTGACATDTFINHLIRGWIQLGAAMRYDFRLELVPVDYCTKAVAHIALSGAAPQTYHLPGARSVDMDEIVDHIIALGHPLRLLPYPQWREELIAAVERGADNELAPYIPLFHPDRPAEEIGLAGSHPVFDNSRLTAALAGSGIQARPVDRELMDLYLRYFVSIGYLPAPPAAVSSNGE